MAAVPDGGGGEGAADHGDAHQAGVDAEPAEARGRDEGVDQVGDHVGAQGAGGGLGGDQGRWWWAAAAAGAVGGARARTSQWRSSRPRPARSRAAARARAQRPTSHSGWASRSRRAAARRPSRATPGPARSSRASDSASPNRARAAWARARSQAPWRRDARWARPAAALPRNHHSRSVRRASPSCACSRPRPDRRPRRRHLQRRLRQPELPLEPDWPSPSGPRGSRGKWGQRGGWINRVVAAGGPTNVRPKGDELLVQARHAGGPLVRRRAHDGTVASVDGPRSGDAVSRARAWAARIEGKKRKAASGRKNGEKRGGGEMVSTAFRNGPGLPPGRTGRRYAWAATRKTLLPGGVGGHRASGANPGRGLDNRKKKEEKKRNRVIDAGPSLYAGSPSSAAPTASAGPRGPGPRTSRGLVHLVGPSPPFSLPSLGPPLTGRAKPASPGPWLRAPTRPSAPGRLPASQSPASSPPARAGSAG